MDPSLDCQIAEALMQEVQCRRFDLVYVCCTCVRSDSLRLRPPGCSILPHHFPKDVQKLNNLSELHSFKTFLISARSLEWREIQKLGIRTLTPALQ